MPSGRINTNGKLAPWKHNSARDMTPPERVSTDRSIEEYKLRKKEKAKSEKLKKAEHSIKKFGRPTIITSIGNSSFQLTYSKYKGITLKVVAKKDPAFLESFIKAGHYTISEKTLAELKSLIKGARHFPGH